MKFKTLSITLLTATLALTGCTTNQDDSSLDDILDRGTFILGLDATFAPMGFINDNNQIVGFDIDIAREVTERLGVELVLQSIDWDAKILELNSGAIDAIWNGFTITPSRREEVSFSLPYLNNRQVVLTNVEGLDTLAELAGKKVGVQLQSSGQIALEASTIYSSISEVVKFSTYDLAIADLQSGRIDAVVIDEVMGRYVNAELGLPFTVLEEDLGDEEYGIGFRKNDLTLTDRINEILLEMKADGTAAAISIAWFGEDIFLPGEE